MRKLDDVLIQCVFRECPERPADRSRHQGDVARPIGEASVGLIVLRVITVNWRQRVEWG